MRTIIGKRSCVGAVSNWTIICDDTYSLPLVIHGASVNEPKANLEAGVLIQEHGSKVTLREQKSMFEQLKVIDHNFGTYVIRNSKISFNVCT